MFLVTLPSLESVFEEMQEEGRQGGICTACLALTF